MWSNSWLFHIFYFYLRTKLNKTDMEDKVKQVRELLSELIDEQCSVIDDTRKEMVIDATMNSFAAFVCKAMYDGFKENI